MRTPIEHAVASAVITLMRGVVYRESAEDVWATLENRGAAVRDHFATIGVEVVVDDTEGYAFLRNAEPAEGEEPLPAIVKRRKLSYNASLLLVLLRKRLVEFETSGGDAKLVLSRDELIELVRLFLADSTNEARVVERIDATIKQVAELGFLHELRDQPAHFEVRRVLKAYVDAQTLSDFAGKLDEYRAQHEEA